MKLTIIVSQDKSVIMWTIYKNDDNDYIYFYTSASVMDLAAIKRVIERKFKGRNYGVLCLRLIVKSKYAEQTLEWIDSIRMLSSIGGLS
jgi:hypothetical protein